MIICLNEGRSFTCRFREINDETILMQSVIDWLVIGVSEFSRYTRGMIYGNGWRVFANRGVNGMSVYVYFINPIDKRLLMEFALRFV